jgi:membrane protein
VKGLAKEFYAQFKEHRVTSLAAAFAYHTVFAIPALIILTITIAAVIDKATSVNVVGQLRDLIDQRAPADLHDLLSSILDSAIAKTGGGAASIGLVVTAVLALWSGSNAIGALIEAFNRAYGVDETRKTIPLKLRTLGLTLLLALFINLAFVLLVFGQRIGHWIASKAGLGGVFNFTWNVLRWPAAIVVIAFILAVLYSAGPNVEQSFRWISPGSALATILWLIATGGFSLYLSVSNPGSAYGALGSVLVLLFFLYVSGIIFLLGAELNALLAIRFDPKTARDVAGKQ